MIYLKGRVHKIADGNLCLIAIPNDTNIHDIIQVYSDKLEVGMPVAITIEPLKVRSVGAGFMSKVLGLQP
jgi:hypothetical protein